MYSIDEKDVIKMIKLYCHIDYKDELTCGKEYVIGCTVGEDKFFVKNNNGWHEQYDSSWFKTFPPQICVHQSNYDSLHVDGELVDRLKNKDDLLKFL